jgi:translation initiation factor 2B subunit (eIF-2B alpha/beta/delta family)
MKMSDNENLIDKKSEYWRKEVEEIKKDSTHGSIYLGNRAMDVIEDFVRKQLYKNRTELFQSFSKLVNALVRAKPLMALIYTRSHRILDFILNFPKEERDISDIKKQVLTEIDVIRKETLQKQKSITKFGSRLILDQHVILTHSASAVVEGIFLKAKRLKKHFRVICTESRPLLEGTQLAIRLAKAEVKTRLIPDADVSRVMKDANFLLTGADRITETSLINKTGTLNAAIVAKELNVPFYIAIDTAKILPKRSYPAKFAPANEKEILDKKYPELTPENYYFEEIPLSYVHKVVCETGIFETEEFIERFLNF